MRFSFSVNKRRLIAAAVLIAAALAACVFIHAAPRFVAVIAVLLAAGGVLRVEITGRWAWLLELPLAFAAAFVTVLLAQRANALPLSRVGAGLLLLGALSLMLLILLLMLAGDLFRRRSAIPAVLTGTAALFLLSIISWYTFDRRGTALTLGDFYAARTAWNVLGGYSVGSSTLH